MDLSIIIPSYGTRGLLDRCLRSIYDSLKVSKLSFEIIVVDNASDDGSVELLKKKYPRVQTIFNKDNLGYGKANNQGIKKAKGKYVLLLNSDISVVDSGIERLWQFATMQSNAFVGGKLFNEDGTSQPSCGPMYSLPIVFLMLFTKGDRLGITRYAPQRVQSVDWVSGACLIGPKLAFVEVGLFDERIFMYMEEIEFLYRAKQKGYTVFFYPNAHFVHTGAASSGERRTPVVNIYLGLLYFYRKHRGPLALGVLRLLLVAKALAAIIIGRMIGRKDLFVTYEEALRMVFR